MSYSLFILHIIFSTLYLSFTSFVLIFTYPSHHLSYSSFILHIIFPTLYLFLTSFVLLFTYPLHHLSYSLFILHIVFPTLYLLKKSICCFFLLVLFEGEIKVRLLDTFLIHWNTSTQCRILPPYLPPSHPSKFILTYLDPSWRSLGDDLLKTWIQPHGRIQKFVRGGGLNTPPVDAESSLKIRIFTPSPWPCIRPPLFNLKTTMTLKI